MMQFENFDNFRGETITIECTITIKGDDGRVLKTVTETRAVDWLVANFAKELADAKTYNRSIRNCVEAATSMISTRLRETLVERYQIENGKLKFKCIDHCEVDEEAQNIGGFTIVTCHLTPENEIWVAIPKKKEST